MRNFKMCHKFPAGNILGIHDGHDAGVALVRNGKVWVSINEERLSRKKLHFGFPWKSIDTALKIAELKPNDIDLVVLSSKMTPSFFLRYFQNLYKNSRENLSSFSYYLDFYRLYHHLARKSRLMNVEALLSSKLTKKRISKVGFDCDIKVVEHHLAHAYSTYMTSGFREALVITMDALGDGLSTTVWVGKNQDLERIFDDNIFHSVGEYYARITDLIGFIPGKDEGKTMALSAYGKPSRALKYMKGIFNFDNYHFNFSNGFFKRTKSKGIYQTLLNKFKPEDIAAAAQKNLEEGVIKFISYWIDETDKRNIALAGGVFANVKLNQKIHELPYVHSVYIFPHMGDGGLAVGAALYAWSQKMLSQGKIPNHKELETIYLGPKYPDKEIKQELKKQGMKFEVYNDIESTIAELLAKGKTIARFNGRMGYGPRALGNRSILYQATDATVKKWLNEKLKRERFMPFAPSTLEEHGDKCYENLKGAEYTAKFMTIAFDCTDWMNENCPGAVHVDGTARPQLVSKEDNSSFYKIIDEYRKITGLPTIINTSFNIHGEPIVCSPEDAIRTFRKAKLDYLAIGNYLVKNK